MRTFPNGIWAYVLVAASVRAESCGRTEFECGGGKCISGNRVCNGVQDCENGRDEFKGCTPCNRTYFGQVGRTYELEVKRPTEVQMPFLCYLNFTAAGGALGEIVQLSFESFAVGTFESFTSEGCLEGFISIREGGRPNLGGKWCGSSWGYTVYYSETPSVNVTLNLERFPQQQSSGYTFEFKLSYKFLRLADARLRYGNATQRSYRGRLSTGTYCDRLLEGCSKRPCRIQSPNFPGIYPRNATCHFRVRERNVPQGKHAMIAIRQANFQRKEHAEKFDGSERVLRIWDQCNTMQDYLEVVDGWGNDAPTLAHLCSGETVPEIISSGPELLVKFQTSPFGNPFHPLPLSYLPGFELVVEVFYVTKHSPTYAPSPRCDFLLTPADSPSGMLSAPAHSLPPNSTCHYSFRGRNREIVWVSFVKYYAAAAHANFGGECDVHLRIWDGDSKATLIGQFCREEKPKLCDHSMLRNASRETRPCGVEESYVSSGPDLTIAHSTKYGSVLYPVNFLLKYEFVDLSQEGTQFSHNVCDRLFKATPSGRFSSPKITFLYGRGGQENLTCRYRFEGTSNQRLKLTFFKASFGRRCDSLFNPEIERWVCEPKGYEEGLAMLQVLEHPWAGVELRRDCLCSNLSHPLVFLTSTSRVTVEFSVAKMRIFEDWSDYFFEGGFEFVPQVEDCNGRRLRGSSGEISPSNRSLCLHKPWLIEPEDPLRSFIYLKVEGVIKRDSRLCPNKNRILVYPASRTEEVRVVCPHLSSPEDAVEMFSDGWSASSYHLQRENSRSFVVEFLQREVGTFAVTWMEVSKNPTALLMPNCKHNCPELGACISSELWCDGMRHCPSGSDEQEANCVGTSGFPLPYLGSVAVGALGLVVLATVVILVFYFFRCWRRDQSNVIVSVTEHTFLEFKSGLC